MLDKKALSREIQDALETVDPKSENLSKDTWNAVSAAIVKNLKNTVEITKDFLPHTHPELQQAVSTTTGPVVSIGRGIIESGANANGNYVKYEDGTMMQWGIIANGSVSFGAINGGNSYTQSITLPQPFTDVDSYSVQASGDVSANYVEVVRAFRGTASTFTVEVNMATLGAGSQNLNGVSWFAIGKWVSATNLAGAYTYGQGVVETGSNSNGTYIKFDNGTMICYTPLAGLASTGYGTSGSTKPLTYFGTVAWTFPAAFVLNPVATQSILFSSNNLDAATGYSSNLSTTSVTVVSYASSEGPYTHAIMAVGRWK